MQKLNDKRTRIRGVKEVVTADGQTEEQVVAQKVFLPNIIFRLVRNHTPPGRPYNPYEATFRVSQSVTKTDIRSYLFAVYGVKTTYIRTDNYLPPALRPGREQMRKAYKRAVVGLVDPFYYPQAVEDMEASQRAEREEWLEEKFLIAEDAAQRKQQLLKLTKKNSKDWRWRTGVIASRKNIIQRIADQRAAREAVVADTKTRMQDARSKEIVVA